jgi:penicillin amidase
LKIDQSIRTVTISGTQFDIRRTAEGVMEMWGKDDLALATALGFAHGVDRMLQLMLVRLAGQGRLSECLQNDEQTLEWDRRAREFRFDADAKDDVANLSDEARRIVENYCRGLNYCLKKYGSPWEFRLPRYRPELEPWCPADCLLCLKVVSYLALAESQQAMEQFIFRSIKSGVDPDRLRKLFRPHLDGLTEEIVGFIKRARIAPFSSPPSATPPGFKGSNNWVVAGRRTVSSLPLECHDPHLPVNQLPKFWYEFIQHTPDDFRIGVSSPGMPCMVMGRTRNISYGFTFGFMDMVDYFIEEVREGRCRRGKGFEELKFHTEVISPKRNLKDFILCKPRQRITVKLWETGLGAIEPPRGTDTLEDGLYMCRAWSAERAAAAQALNAFLKATSAGTVSALQQILAEVTVSCNWLMADKEGNIGYQQSGRLPLRQHSGLFPLPAWDESYHWNGYAAADQLARISNPPEGYLVTANNDLNQQGKPLSINLPMGPERAERISQLLKPLESCTVENMKTIQRDLYSLQAERFMTLLRLLLPETPTGRLLKEWDYRYTKESRGAFLFEEIYRGLLEEVFEKGVFGEEIWRREVAETGLLVDYYHFFDRALLGDDPPWFGVSGRDAVLRSVVERVLRIHPIPELVPTWGSARQVIMTNLFFDGKLPRFLGFDYGPLTLEGNRATVVQGAIYKSMGRTTTFAPSYRFITDLAETKAHTSLAGGPSDRRFSRWYTTGILRWLKYEYKVLEGGNGNSGQYIRAIK